MLTLDVPKVVFELPLQKRFTAVSYQVVSVFVVVFVAMWCVPTADSGPSQNMITI